MNLKTLVQGLKKLEERAESAELAYLCLSGKSENHIRDLVSFNIAQAKPKWLVQREINKVDLVITNTASTKMNIEFKMGYSGVVASAGQSATVIVEAMKDIEKRGTAIVNCIGIMNFTGPEDSALGTYRNPALIKRSLSTKNATRKVKRVVKDTWPNSRCRFTEVKCGGWRGIHVNILFCIVKHT